jgi:N-acetyl-gamma-glutamyl-phosphate reductase
VRSEKIDVVFLATPAEVSIDLTPSLLDAGARVIDLSGAFRLRTVENYARWYGASHAQPELLATAVYGLPEFYRDQVKGARIVANPGCYPTAANLAIRPLVQSGAVDLAAGIVCDAKSGASGAGRKASLKTSFCEVAGNFSAYSILDHRHVPEVLMNSGLEEAQFVFTAHLLPLDRGILETIYARLRPGFDAASLVRIYEEHYGNEPFIKMYDPGQVPDLHSVCRTNRCHIGVKAEGGRAVVVSVIDNLIKGAAGQAIQNMNLMLGYPETEGLL